MGGVWLRIKKFEADLKRLSSHEKKQKQKCQARSREAEAKGQGETALGIGRERRKRKPNQAGAAAGETPHFFFVPGPIRSAKATL